MSKEHSYVTVFRESHIAKIAGLILLVLLVYIFYPSIKGFSIEAKQVIEKSHEKQRSNPYRAEMEELFRIKDIQITKDYEYVKDLIARNLVVENTIREANNSYKALFDEAVTFQRLTNAYKNGESFRYLGVLYDQESAERYLLSQAEKLQKVKKTLDRAQTIQQRYSNQIALKNQKIKIMRTALEDLKFEMEMKLLDLGFSECDKYMANVSRIGTGVEGDPIKDMINTIDKSIAANQVDAAVGEYGIGEVDTNTVIQRQANEIQELINN